MLFLHHYGLMFSSMQIQMSFFKHCISSVQYSIQHRQQVFSKYPWDELISRVWLGCGTFWFSLVRCSSLNHSTVATDLQDHVRVLKTSLESHGLNKKRNISRELKGEEYTKVRPRITSSILWNKGGNLTLSSGLWYKTRLFGVAENTHTYRVQWS